jgi:hypothetical protein
MTTPADHQDRELRQRLSALRTDPPVDAAFRAALHRRLAEAGPPAEPSRWGRLAEALRTRRLLWPALGAAAGAAAVLLLASPMLRHPDAAPAPFGTSLRATQVAVVRLNLSADGPVDAAHIRVSLPPGLSFWAEGQELAVRDFEWSQPLEAGDNEIPIAVRGQRPGRYRIGVDARVGGQRIQDEVLIEVTGG